MLISTAVDASQCTANREDAQRREEALWVVLPCESSLNRTGALYR